MKEEKAKSLIHLTVDTSTNVLRAFCQKRLLCSHEQDLANFLDKNRHYFFHQFEVENIRCCECSASVCEISKENDIPQLEFLQVYQSCGNPVDGHIKKDGENLFQRCLHAYKARTISVADLDIESLSVYLLHKGDLTKIEIQWLYVIRRSAEILKEALLKPIFPIQLNWKDLKEAVVSLTSQQYYQPIVKALFEIIQEEENEKSKMSVAAATFNQEQASSCNKELDNRHKDNSIQSSVPYMINRIQVETCKTVKVIRNFTLNVQYQKMVPNDESQILPSFEQIQLEVMWHFETPSNWKIGRIIRKLKSKSYEISSNMLIRIKRINKGSLNILTSVDFNVFSNREAWESVCELFLGKIVEAFDVQTSRTRTPAIDVSAEIINQDVSEQYEIAHTSTTIQFPLPDKAVILSMRHQVYAHTIYPGYFLCDGIFVDCIVDGRLSKNPSKKGWWNYDSKTADLTTQFKLMLNLQKAIQKYGDNEVPFKNFQDDLAENITMIRQGMGFPFKINDGMMCRFILAHLNKFDNNDMKELYSSLQNAVGVQTSHNAKVIAWKFTRLFVKTLSKKKYYDIWPGFICVCNDESNIPCPLWFCSQHIVIVVEVFDIDDVKPRPKSFYEIPITYRVVNGYSKEANLISQKLDQLKGKKDEFGTPTGLQKEIAKDLFAAHTKLCLISSSPFKSKHYKKKCVEHIKTPCLQLFCRAKGIIPVGEAHFPRSIDSIATDVLEGHPQLLVQDVKIGSEIGVQNGRAGTLGGFVKFHGKDAFLTCAHVILEQKYLVSNVCRADIHDHPISVYCQNPGGWEFPCGKLVSYVFPPEEFEGSSVDAAIIKLKSVPMSPVTIDNAGNSLPPVYLHRNFIDYKEIGIKDELQIVAVGAVSSLQQESHKINIEYKIQVEFETLTDAVQKKIIQNPHPTDISDRIHFVERIIQDVGKEELRTPRTVTLYNQISMRRMAFSPGDSGTCVYAKRQDGNFLCVGMAITSHPDGGCIITPIRPILSAFKLI